MQTILLKETIHVIVLLDAILRKPHQSDQALIDDLKAYLANRWEKIAGYYLSYTNGPNSIATQLCLTVAQWLHQQDNSKAAYQYLMPTITCTIESFDLYNNFFAEEVVVFFLFEN